MPGSDVAGVVAAVGRAVTEYVVGDELFGELAGYLGGLADLGRAGGVFVVALAEHAGAEVPAVDRADKADFLHEIGTDRTIDFATEDWADERGNFDLIVDLVAHRSPFRVHGALRRGGRYAMVGGLARILLGTAVAGALMGRATGRRVGVLVVPQSRAELEAMTALVTQGAATPRIDRVPLTGGGGQTFGRYRGGAASLR